MFPTILGIILSKMPVHFLSLTVLFQEYDFEIIVKPGRMNKGSDHLSRLEHGEEPTSLEDTLPDAQLLVIRNIDDHFTDIV
jgi:hypothetical protein